jgi:hypothetical protein
MWFNQNRHIAEEFYEIRKKISNVELELEKMKSHIISVRGLVNRSRKNKEEEMTEESPEEESPEEKVLLSPEGQKLK